MGALLFPLPDNNCTPGEYDSRQVCTQNTRTYLPTADRTKIINEYGFLTWSGTRGELDHRVPVFLGGLTTTKNVWPERGAIPNLKDKLEFSIYRRVCVNHTMRPRTARFIFRGDWTAYYRKYISD